MRDAPIPLRWKSSISSSLTDFVKIKTLLDRSLRHSLSNVSRTCHFPHNSGRSIAGPYLGTLPLNATLESSLFRAVYGMVGQLWYMQAAVGERQRTCSGLSVGAGRRP